MSVTPMRKRRQQGSSLLEFLLVSILLIFPLLFGTFIFGMRLVRANQVSELCRDAGHMYAYRIDFSQTGSQQVLAQLAQGLKMTANGGNGEIILSTITFIASADCVAGGYPAGDCLNVNQTVFTNRIVVGNPALNINSQLQTSAFGTPDPAFVDSFGDIKPAYYLTNAGAVASNFSSVIRLNSGQVAYVAEAFFQAPDFNLLNPGGITARSIF